MLLTSSIISPLENIWKLSRAAGANKYFETAHILEPHSTELSRHAHKGREMSSRNHVELSHVLYLRRHKSSWILTTFGLKFSPFKVAEAKRKPTWKGLVT